MIWRRSLRLRLLLGAAVWITLALALAGIVIDGLFAQHVRQRFEAELGHHLDQLAAALDVGPNGAPVVTRALSDPLFQRPFSGLYWQVEGPAGPAQRSRSLWDAHLRLPAESPAADGALRRYRLAGPNGSTLFAVDRLVRLADAPAPYRAVVAMDESEIDGAVAAFTRALVLSLAVLGAVLVAAALIQTELGLRPLAHLRRELALVRARRKSRLAGPMPAEVQPLTDDLNALLDHDREVVARARAQAGNLAHALKTNLAILGNAAQGLAPDDPAGELIAEQVGLMRRHIDHHLARARAAAARNVPGTAAPVREVASALARTMARLYPDRGLTIAVDGLADDMVRAERQDLEEMLGNLLDNACKWARRRIEVTSRQRPDGMVAIAVDDDGPGLPAAAGSEALPARGVRLDESVPGSGLGLAIVEDLAGLYGGALALGRSPSGGLRAEVALPPVRPLTHL